MVIIHSFPKPVKMGVYGGITIIVLILDDVDRVVFFSSDCSPYMSQEDYRTEELRFNWFNI